MRIHISADLKDVHDFDHTVAQIAVALANDPRCPESLDIRRSMAIGILADPEQAVRILNQGTPAATPGSPASSDPATDDPVTDDPGDPATRWTTGSPRDPAAPGRTVGRPRKQVMLHLHISDQALAGTGMGSVGSMEYANRVVLAEMIRQWCGRPDTHLTVLPVLDLGEHMSTDSYQGPQRLATQTELKHPSCTFPWCTRPARRCDKDHSIPHARGGTTCSCNIVPLCRRHHRLKTHTLWSHHLLEPGVVIWRAPHGRQYLRDQTGTTDVGPAPAAPPTTDDRSPPWTGCFHQAS